MKSKSMKVQISVFCFLSLSCVFNVCSMSGPAKDEHTLLSDLLEHVDKLPTELVRLVDQTMGSAPATFRCPRIQYDGYKGAVYKRIAPGGKSVILFNDDRDSYTDIKVYDITSGTMKWSYRIDMPNSDVVVSDDHKHVVMLSIYDRAVYHVTTQDGCKKDITGYFSDQGSSEFRLSWLANQNMVTVWDSNTYRAFLYDIRKQIVVDTKTLKSFVYTDLALQKNGDCIIRNIGCNMCVKLTIGRHEKRWVRDFTLPRAFTASADDLPYNTQRIVNDHDGQLIGVCRKGGKAVLFSLDLDGIHVLDAFECHRRLDKSLLSNAGTIICKSNVFKMYRLQDLLSAYRACKKE